MIAKQIYSGRTVSDAWLQAFTAVAEAPGQRLYHLVVQIDAAHRELPKIRHIADDVLASLKLADEPTIVTVRNTIFPKGLVRSVNSPSDLPRAFEEGREGRKRLRVSNAKGRYFERLIALHRSDGQPFNQLAHTIEKLKGAKARARYEIDLMTEVDVPDGLGVYSSERDADKPSRMGFPCLSHLAFQTEQNRVHCVAFYRSQDLSTRGYGNYWGIGQLQEFVAKEATLTPGTLTVIAGIATLGITRENARQFIERAGEATP